MRKEFDKINELITCSKNILIASHGTPDEDAVGSSLALKLALKKQGIDSLAFISGYSLKEFNFLPGYDSINSRLKHNNFDLIFGLDYGNVHRLGIDNLLKQANAKIVTIDHHVDEGANHIGDIKILESASSTAELIYSFLKECGWPIDKNIATCILTGIIGDTGGFVHSNTSHNTLLTVGELLSKGVRINKIIKQISDSKTLVNNFELFGRLLSKVEKYPELDLVYLIISKEDFGSWHKGDLENLASILNAVEDCRWALVLIEYEKGKTKASLRSEEYKGVDVSKIASLFGGGGHKLSSGFRSKHNPDKVFKHLIKKAKKVIV